MMPPPIAADGGTADAADAVTTVDHSSDVASQLAASTILPSSDTQNHIAGSNQSSLSSSNDQQCNSSNSSSHIGSSSATFNSDQLLHLKDNGSSSNSSVGAEFGKQPRKKLLIAMVGLPARGKSYISKKLTRWLNWTGYKAATFNVSTYRRRLSCYTHGRGHSAEFFDPNNTAATQQREQCAQSALADVFAFFDSGGHCAVYDGTNSTRQRRQLVIDAVQQHNNNSNSNSSNSSSHDIELVWIESICHDEAVIEANIRETKLTSPDYSSTTPAAAVADYRARIAHYQSCYESLNSSNNDTCNNSNNNTSYVQITTLTNSGSHSHSHSNNHSREITCHNIQGYLLSKLVAFLMNLRISHHSAVYLTRHGESEYNTRGWIGGDSELTERGKAYAQALAVFIHNEPELKIGTATATATATAAAVTEATASDSNQPQPPRQQLNLNVWCSTLQRTVQTATALQLPFVQWQALKEIAVGSCEGLSYEQIAAEYPLEFSARKANKLHYRYPQGESYMDVVSRLEPVIMELERIAAPILLICHRAVARCLYSYFLDELPEVIPHLDMPLHTVMKLQPKAYGCVVSRYALGVPSVESEGVE